MIAWLRTHSDLDSLLNLILPAKYRCQECKKATTMSDTISPLGPIDPASVPEAETEKAAPWIVRKLVGVSNGPCYRLFPSSQLTIVDVNRHATFSRRGILCRTMQSMTGRIVRSSWETLRASGTSVVCLSPVCRSAVFSAVEPHRLTRMACCRSNRDG